MIKKITFAAALFLIITALTFASGSKDYETGYNNLNTQSLNNCNTNQLIADDSLSAREVWNNYINAIGGLENLKKINDRATIMESQVKGQHIVMTIYQKAPDKMKQIIATPSLTQEIFFNGSSGILKIDAKELDITGGQLEKLKYEAMINFVVDIDSLGIKLISGGIEKVNGNNCYKIDIIYPSGSKITEYFDSKSWLKVKQVEDVAAAGKTYVQETYFSDYREVMGVKYPYSVKESLGAESFAVKVTSIKINSGFDDSLFEVK